MKLLKLFIFLSMFQITITEVNLQDNIENEAKHCGECPAGTKCQKTGVTFLGDSYQCK